jgi:hypothetical protein
MQIALSNAVGAVWLWPDLCLSSHRDELDQTVGQGGAHESETHRPYSAGTRIGAVAAAKDVLNMRATRKISCGSSAG